MKKSFSVLSLVLLGLLNTAQANWLFPDHHDHHNVHKSVAVGKHESTPKIDQKIESDVLNFSIPQNKPLETCLKLEMSFYIDIDYYKTGETTKSTQRFELTDNTFNTYTGECNASLNTLNIIWQDSWTLMLNYTIVDKIYQLDSISLKYMVDSLHFPNVTEDQKGTKWINATNIALFSTVSGNSFKCRSDTRVVSDDKRALISIKNYHGQPFMTGNAGKPREFGTAVECIGDRFNANKLVPIIVGSVLSALVLIILISYIVGRRKHRSSPGYEQV